jgi:alpha-N-arabinofuranosidase
LFIVNKDLDEDIYCVTDVSGFRCEEVVEWVSLFGYAAEEVNTLNRSPVKPRQINNAEINSDKVSFTLPKASWNMLRVKIVVENKIN